MYCNNSSNLFLNAFGPINAVSYFETDLLIYAKKKFQKVFFVFQLRDVIDQTRKKERERISDSINFSTFVNQSFVKYKDNFGNQSFVNYRILC
jgi:hypothetical protein